MTEKIEKAIKVCENTDYVLFGDNAKIGAYKEMAEQGLQEGKTEAEIINALASKLSERINRYLKTNEMASVDKCKKIAYENSYVRPEVDENSEINMKLINMKFNGNRTENLLKSNNGEMFQLDEIEKIIEDEALNIKEDLGYDDI